MAMSPWFVVTGVPLGKQIGTIVSVIPSFKISTFIIIEPLLNVTITLFIDTPNCAAYKAFTLSIIFALLTSDNVDKFPFGIVKVALYSTYGSFVSGTISLVILEIFTFKDVRSDVNVLLLIIANGTDSMNASLASLYLTVTDALPKNMGTVYPVIKSPDNNPITSTYNADSTNAVVRPDDWKAVSPMLVVEAGRVIDVNDDAPSNAPFPMLLSNGEDSSAPRAKFIDDKLDTLKNAYAPILVTVAGTVIDVK